MQYKSCQLTPVLHLSISLYLYLSHPLFRDFDFPRYLTLAQENSIMKMLTVSPAHWSAFLVILAGNYIRVHFNLELALSHDLIDDSCRSDDKEKQKVLLLLESVPLY